jgi:hypothetical protein
MSATLGTIGITLMMFEEKCIFFSLEEQKKHLFKMYKVKIFVNREHFSDNQTFTAQKAKFTRDAQCKLNIQNQL